MGGMLHEQVLKPSDVPSVISTNSHGSAFMENLSIILKYSDDQSISWSNAVVNFIADVQKREEFLVQPIPGATTNCHRSTEIAEKHSGAAITLETKAS
jgi:hypothetical protein